MCREARRLEGYESCSKSESIILIRVDIDILSSNIVGELSHSSLTLLLGDIEAVMIGIGADVFVVRHIGERPGVSDRMSTLQIDKDTGSFIPCGPSACRAGGTYMVLRALRLLLGPRGTCTIKSCDRSDSASIGFCNFLMSLHVKLT